MEHYYILNEQGNPIPEPNLEAWSSWFERTDRGVTRTAVTPDVMVLTTFSGVSMNPESGNVPTEENAPMLFETRVFGGSLDGEMEQYPTRAEALTGHMRLIEWCRLGESSDNGVTEDQII